MAASINQIAQEYINEAQRNPHRAPDILRRAAAHFAQMASQPANMHASQKLTMIGLDFAGAAMARQRDAAQSTNDDFAQLLRDTHQAVIEIGPDAMSSSHAAMDAIAQRRGNETTDAQGMSIQPRTFLNQDTTLGRTTKIKFNPTDDEKAQGVKQSETVAFWQGRKMESQAMSVDFGLTLPPPVDLPLKTNNTAIVDSRLYAMIMYGADGNTQTQVTLDVRLGQRTVMVGNYISVLVGMDPPRHYEPPGTDETLGISTPIVTVGASIGTFAAPTIAPVTRTIYVDQIDPSLTPGSRLSKAFPIPQRAITLLPPVAASPTDTLTVWFFNYNGDFIGKWQSVFSPTTPFWSPYPLPADAYFFRVESLQGVPTPAPLVGGRNGIRIPFQLSL